SRSTSTIPAVNSAGSSATVGSTAAVSVGGSARGAAGWMSGDGRAFGFATACCGAVFCGAVFCGASADERACVTEDGDKGCVSTLGACEGNRLSCELRQRMSSENAQSAKCERSRLGNIAFGRSEEAFVIRSTPFVQQRAARKCVRCRR